MADDTNAQAPSTELWVERTGVRRYTGRSSRGAEVLVGSADVEGVFTPGELLKIALAACSGMSTDHVLARRLGQDRDLAFHLVQQGRLHVQVVDGVGAQRQFGEDQQVCATFARLTDQGQMLLRIRLGVSHMNHRRRRRHAHEAVGLGGMEHSNSHRIVRITRPAPVVDLHIGANDEGTETLLRGYAPRISSGLRVRTRTPSLVTATVCSNWADSFPSEVTTVQPSGSTLV